MVAQNCPRCSSNRIRHGYRPTPIWAKVLFRYNLLCDSCNWEFRGFAIPGTVTTKPTKKRKKGKENNSKIEGKGISSETDDRDQNADEDSFNNQSALNKIENKEKEDKPNTDSSNQRKEKRVRIKL